MNRALGASSFGTQCGNKALGMSSIGMYCSFILTAWKEIVKFNLSILRVFKTNVEL